jgi:three-Cys-motif partner protein
MSLSNPDKLADLESAARELGTVGSQKPAPNGCEGAEWHSRQKHTLLDSYLRIWTDRVGKSPFSKGNAPPLQIVDLYAAFGWCHDDKLGETWPGTAVLAASCLKAYQTRYARRLVLNSYSPKSLDASGAQLAALQAAIRALDIESGGCEVRYFSAPIVEAIGHSKQVVDPRFPSIWILDPYDPADLPWFAVESIAQFEGAWSRGGEPQIRRPELFINLMTSTLQRTLDISPEKMTAAIGLPEAEWRRRLESSQAGGLNYTEGIVELYLERLSRYYHKRPLAVKIPATQGNIVYYFVFCTESEPGYFMMRKAGVPEYEVWRGRKWIPVAEFLKARGSVERKAEKAGHTAPTLDSFPEEPRNSDGELR